MRGISRLSPHDRGEDALATRKPENRSGCGDPSCTPELSRDLARIMGSERLSLNAARPPPVRIIRSGLPVQNVNKIAVYQEYRFAVRAF
jgi:hypothetical protein